jgi:RNA polymerase sigma-70 factor (ECF subfamily)
MGKNETEARTNDEWIAALRGECRDSAEAIRDLGDYLRRILWKVVAGRCSADLAEELAQESMVRIVQALPSFRGDSAFKTWAAAIATRTAFTHLRRTHAREQKRDRFEDVLRETNGIPAHRGPTPLESLARGDVLSALDAAIRTELSERQRTAILAELRGIPTIEIANRMGTNQNALYKLTHDARRKLRRALAAAGHTADSIAEATR